MDRHQVFNSKEGRGNRTIHGFVNCCWRIDCGKEDLCQRFGSLLVLLVVSARVFTETVLKAGDRVVPAARNPERLVELESRYLENIRTVALDVTNETQATGAFEAAIASFGRLDVLVNNAGYGTVGPVEDTSLADFRAQVETNLFGVIIMTKAVLPYFRERRAGYIIQVTSIAGRIGPAGRAPYAAAKFGVEGFSESLSKEIGPLGVKVTIIEPGGFRTDFAGSSTETERGPIGV